MNGRPQIVSKPRLLLFDIDGTLLLARGRGMRAMHAALQAVFACPPRQASIQPHGKTDFVLFEEMACAYGLEFAALAARADELQHVYATHLEALLSEPNSVELRPGVLALLQGLAARQDVHLGIVTGNLERTARLKLVAAGLDRFFATGGFGSDARERPGLVAHALQRFGTITGREWSGSDVWVIGDTPDDVGSGRAHGTRTLAVATGSHDLESLQQTGADLVLPDLSDTDRIIGILCGSEPK